MASFKDGDTLLFMMNDDHKRPNIIRGSVSKTPKNLGLPQSQSQPTTVSKALKQFSLDNFSSTDLENVQFSNPPDLSEVQTPVDSISNNSEYQTEDESIQNTMEDPNVRIVMNENGELQLVTSDQIETEFTESVDESDEQIVQASLQTDEGEFVIFVKRGEIISCQPASSMQLQDFEKETLTFEDEIVQESPIITTNVTNVNETIETHEVEEYEQDVDHHATSLKIEEVDESFEASNNSAVIEETGDVSYVMVQLQNGSTILVPASALQGATVDDGQIVLNGNDHIVQMINSAAGISDSQPPTSSSTKYTTKPKKRAAPVRQPKSAPNKSFKMQMINSVRTGNEYLAPSHQMNAIANAIVNQRNVNGGIQQYSEVNDGGGGNTSRNDASIPRRTLMYNINNNIDAQVNHKVQIDVKPRPFRFDMPESDDDSMEFGSNAFLPLVIGNYKTSIENQKRSAAEAEKSNEGITLTANEENLTTLSVTSKIKVEQNNPAYTPPLVQCSKCTFKTRGRNSLSQHMSKFHNEELPYTCSKCQRKFPYHYLLVGHMKTHETDTINNKFVCKSCKMEFSLETDLKAHNMNPCGSLLSSNSENVSSYSSNTTSLVVNKSLHRRKQQVYVRNKQFPCLVKSCFNWFEDEFAVIKHKLLAHNVEGPFECELCKEFSTSSQTDMMNHISKHKEEAKKTLICGNTFEYKNHLSGHVRSHLNKESTDVQMRENKLLANPEKLMQVVKTSYRNKKAVDVGAIEVFCEQCDYIFPNQVALDEHIMTLHSFSQPVGKNNESKFKITSFPLNPNENNSSFVMTEVTNGEDLEEVQITFENYSDCSSQNDSQSIVNGNVNIVSTDASKNSIQPSKLINVCIRPDRPAKDVCNDFKMLYSKIQEEQAIENNNYVLNAKEKVQQIEIEKVISSKTMKRIKYVKLQSGEICEDSEESLTKDEISSIVKEMKIKIEDQCSSSVQTKSVSEESAVDNGLNLDAPANDSTEEINSDGEVELTYKRAKLDDSTLPNSNMDSVSSMSILKPTTRSSQRIKLKEDLDSNFNPVFMSKEEKVSHRINTKLINKRHSRHH